MGHVLRTTFRHHATGRWIGLLIVLGMLCAVPAALARSRGTHFLVEGEGGVGVGDTGALAESLGLTFGLGGSVVPGLRFYGVANFSQSWSAEERSNGVSIADWDTSDSMFLFGGRFYIPVGGNLRIMWQMLGGYAWSSSQWDVNRMEHYQADADAFALRWGLGFQVRLMPMLSLGISVDRVVFWGKENELQVASLTGFTDEADENDQTRILGALVFHF